MQSITPQFLHPLSLEISPDSLSQGEPAIRQEIALQLYAQNIFTLGQARRLANISVWEFQKLLAQHKIQRHYNETDLEEDIQEIKNQEALVKQAKSRYVLGKLEAITVYAFLETLLRLTDPLPLNLQENINQMREAITTDTKIALNTTLRELVKDSFISPIYQQIRFEINQRYTPQEASTSKIEDNIIELSELLNTFDKVVEAPSASEKAKMLAPELDRLFNCLF
jgi:predicted HTH domain antitoxin